MKRGAGHNWAWRDFWKSGRSASCVPQDAANRAALEAWWREFFADCADGSRVLDIATGNGVVLRFAQDAADETGYRFEMTGTDLAMIDPHRDVDGSKLDAARFLAATAAENLPFDAGDFDVVVSQYGLEYAALEQALAEATRVAAAGARLCWLAHSPDSVVVRQNRAQHGDVDFLLDRGGPVAAMQRFAGALGRGRRPDTAMAKLDETMRAAEAYCRQHPPADIVTELCRAFAELANGWQQYRPQDLARTVEHNRRELLAHRQRLRDMESAALTPARLEIVRRCLAGPAWEELTVEPLVVGARGEIGVAIRARRTPAGGAG